MKEHRVFHRANDQVYAIVGCNPDLAVVSDVWFGAFDSQAEFRAVLTHVAVLIGGGGYKYWLADLRFMGAGFGGSEEWLVKELMPSVYDAGLQREAVVLPEGAVSREGEDAYGAASSALRELADGRVRGFSEVLLARRWLLDGVLPK